MGAVEAQNKAVIYKLVEAFNNQDRETFVSCYANPIVINTQHETFTMTHDEHWESVEDTFKVFPDFRSELLGVVAEGDRVFQYWTYSGTHLGSTPGGRKPTGKRAEWRAFSDYRFKDGVIFEATQIHDTYEQYLQLGIIEPPSK
ncbi:MAG: ester cyclase [Acidimicrobiia bacterium]